MTTNVFLLSTPEKIGIYLALALCGLSVLLLALTVRRRFRRASEALTTLNKEWESARWKFFQIAEVARQRIDDFPTAPAGTGPPEPRDKVSFDVRSQVAAMGKRGLDTPKIARSAGLSEGEVEVLLGISRMEKRKK